MRGILFIASFLFVQLFNAQVQDSITEQDFMKKLDSIGAIDSAANAQMKYNFCLLYTSPSPRD